MARSTFHEDMMKLQDEGRLDEWCDDNLQWLYHTFGKENTVSAVLHMDEHTPHIQAIRNSTTDSDVSRHATAAVRPYSSSLAYTWPTPLPRQPDKWPWKKKRSGENNNAPDKTYRPDTSGITGGGTSCTYTTINASYALRESNKPQANWKPTRISHSQTY